MSRCPADDLLLACLREDREAVEGSWDWDALFGAAARHGVEPLLFDRIRTLRSPVPAPVMEGLRQAYLQNAARNAQMYRELAQVVKRFRQEGIEVIALKGAHLAAAVYGNIALRRMGDLDLLARQADLPRLRDILLGQGYSPAKEDTVQLLQHLPPFVKQNGPCIEAHFTIYLPHRALAVEGLWARARQATLEGAEVKVLCPEDLVLHLCVHFGLHDGFGSGVKALFDIARTIERHGDEMDWEQVLERGGEWGVKRCLFLALSLARELAGAAVPGGVMRKLDAFPDGPARVAAARELVFARGEPVRGKVARLFGAAGRGKRLAHLLREGFPARARMANLSPGSRNPLSLPWAYFSRLQGLFRAHGGIFWRLARGDEAMRSSVEVEGRRNALRDWMTG